MAKKKTAAAKPTAKKPAGVNKAAAFMILAAMVPFSLPTVIVVFFTMLPTLGAWASEKGRNRYAWLCVGGLNFSGVIPFLFTLWFGVHNLDEAFNLLSDSGVLLWSYGCAVIGWVIYMMLPPAIGRWMYFTTDRRVGALKAAQKRLIDEWGDEVSRKLD